MKMMSLCVIAPREFTRVTSISNSLLVRHVLINKFVTKIYNKHNLIELLLNDNLLSHLQSYIIVHI